MSKEDLIKLMAGNKEEKPTEEKEEKEEFKKTRKEKGKEGKTGKTYIAFVDQPRVILKLPKIVNVKGRRKAELRWIITAECQVDNAGMVEPRIAQSTSDVSGSSAVSGAKRSSSCV